MSKECLYSNDITIKLNDIEVGFAQECSITSSRSYKNVKSYGEPNVYGVALGSKSYEITLIKIQQVQEDIDLTLLSNFTVTIKKQGKIYEYKNCEWIRHCEKVENSKSVIMSAVIVCPNLSVTEDTNG